MSVSGRHLRSQEWILWDMGFRVNRMPGPLRSGIWVGRLLHTFSGIYGARDFNTSKFTPNCKSGILKPREKTAVEGCRFGGKLGSPLCGGAWGYMPVIMATCWPPRCTREFVTQVW